MNTTRRSKKRARNARLMMQRPIPIGIGHNMGPPFEEAYYTYVWKKKVFPCFKKF